MKLVNPTGRNISSLESGANYDVAPLWGCVCSGSTAIANSYNKGPGWCVGYCTGGAVNRDANKDAAYK